MAQTIDKIVKSKYPPKDKNVMWVDTNSNPPVQKIWDGTWKPMEVNENVDYENNVINKPTINGVELDGNKTSQDLGVYSKPSSGIPQSDLSSDVQSQLNKYFKGWYDSSSNLPDNPIIGDYAYVKGAESTDPAAIYECTTAGTWSDSGRTADTSNVQTFASGEEVNETYIDDTHLVNPKSGALPTAEDVMQLKVKLEGVTASETKVQVVESGEGQDVYNGYINGSTGEYTQSSYNKLIVVPLNGAKSVRWLAKENASNPSYLGWAFGTFSGEIDETLSTFTALSKGVYGNNSLDNQAVEYIQDAPNNATHAVITIWIYKSGGGSAVTMDNFYCYLQSGETIKEYVQDIQTDIQNLQSDLYGSPYVMNDSDITNCVLISTGYYYKVSGLNYLGKEPSELITSFDDRFSIHKIEIPKGKYSHVRFKQFSSLDNWGSPMFDENNKMVGYLGYNISISGGNGYAVSIIPSTATYILFCRNSQTIGNKLEFFLNNDSILDSIDSQLNGKTITLTYSTDENTGIYNFNFAKTDEIGYIPSQIGINLFNGSFVYYATNGYFNHLLVPIKGFDSVRFSSFKTSSNWGHAILDKDGNIIDTVYMNYGTTGDYINPYAIPDNACFLVLRYYQNAAYTQTVILTKNKSVNDTVISSGGDAVSLKNGCYLTNGSFSESTNTVITSPINCGNGFYIEVHPDYKIKRSYLFDVNGNMLNYSDRVFENITKSFGFSGSFPQYTMRIEIGRVDGGNLDAKENIIRKFAYLNDGRLKRIIPENQQWGLFKARVNQMFKPTWKALLNLPNYRTYYWLKDTVNRGITYSEAAEFSKYVGWNVAFRTYLTALLNKHSIMYTEDINSSGRHSEYGIRYNGLSDYSRTYYGTVCTSLTSYVAGLERVAISGDWATLNGITVIAWGKRVSKTEGGNTLYKYYDYVEGNDSAYNSATYDNPPTSSSIKTAEYIANIVQPMDFIWNEGHCSVISDVYTDEDGNRQFIIWTEQGRPAGTSSTPYTKETFTNRLYNLVQSGANWKIMRYSNWNELTTKVRFNENPDTPYIQTTPFSYTPDDLNVDANITTFAGEYPSFTTLPDTEEYDEYTYEGANYNVLKNNDKAILTIRRNKNFNYLDIFNEGDNPDVDSPLRTFNIVDNSSEPVSQYTIYDEDSAENEDWIMFDLKKINPLLGAGLYKARVRNSNTNETSGFTHFEMVDITFNVSKEGSTYTCTFSSNQGTPYLIRQERADGMYSVWHLLTDAEITNGSYSSSSFTSNQYSRYLKLYIKGQYGDVVHRITIANL